MDHRHAPEPEADDTRPPLLGSWSRMYAVVLILHFLLLVGFYLISRAYTLP
jgi:hypothetical protein